MGREDVANCENQKSPLHFDIFLAFMHTAVLRKSFTYTTFILLRFTGDGDGQTVYVIDTGILHSHADYGGRASYHFDFEDRVSLPFQVKRSIYKY